MTPERKLRFLKEYMGLWIDRRVDDTLHISNSLFAFQNHGIILKCQAQPELKPFDRWLESTLDKRAHKGEKKAENYRKSVCRYCRRGFDAYASKTKDHIVPVSRGGLDRKENKVPCCWDCNQWKADKDLKAWLKEVQAVLKKEKPRLPYTMTLLGTMIGSIKQVIEETKGKRDKISIYKN